MKRANYFSIYSFVHLLRISKCVAAALVIGILAVAVQPCCAGDFVQDSVVSTDTPSTDSINAQWIATGSLNTGRFVHAATLLEDGRVLVSGGQDSSFETIASSEIYDPMTGVWTTTGSMNQARAQHTQTLLPTGKSWSQAALGITARRNCTTQLRGSGR